MSENRRAMAERHVREGRHIIERQVNLIARQKSLGLSTTISEALLATFERSLAIFEDDLETISGRTVGRTI